MHQVFEDELMERFGTDSLRFFLLREMVFGQDASFSDEAFIDRYNSDLANDLGNTTSRLTTLSRRAFDSCLPPERGGDARPAPRPGDRHRRRISQTPYVKIERGCGN